jgi:hypothetical protein
MHFSPHHGRVKNAYKTHAFLGSKKVLFMLV